MESCDDGNNVDGDGCRNDCTFCGDGIVDSGEDCDDGNNDDLDGCSATCELERQCELEVVKTCFVPDRGDGDDDDDDNDCDGKVLSMKLQYTGEGCDATNNFQEGKAGCLGGAAGAEPVSVRVTDDRGTKVYADAGGVFLGDIVEATAANAGQNEFGTQTDIVIDNGLEDITLHTSCSKPLAVGDQFGSMLLVELTTTNGGTVVLPPQLPDNGTGSDTSECTIPAPPPAPHCDGKIKTIDFRFIGGDCTQTTHDQDGRFSCSGAVNVPVIGITCFAGSDVFYDSAGANVTPGDVITVSAAHAGETQLPTQMDCEITDEFDNVLMTLSLHTSCSKPVNLGDIFGALEVFGLDTTGGGVIGLATEVFYSYKITNHSDFAAVNVTAVDSELGELPGSPIAAIQPDEMVVLEASALISETTTNTVTVNGTLETGEVCEAVEDTATVTVQETPELLECTSKIDAMLLQYIGPDIPGPVTVEVLPRTQTTPVTYEFPGGLANGTIVSSPEQNDYTVDPGVQGFDDAGSKTTIYINGTPEVHHTSCSTPYIAGLPAPLDSPKGDPSPNWFVVSFTQK